MLAAITASAQESFFVQTETRYWDQSSAYNGYTLFGTRGTSYLIDMEGRVVHTWNLGTNPRFTSHGTLLDAVGGDPSKSSSWRELDWSGNIVWQYTESRTGYWPHHDFDCIYNPKLGDTTFIYIANKDLTAAQCLAAGCDPKNDYTGAQMDVIVEVDRKGNVIWEWSFFDHIVQDIDGSKATYGVIRNTPGRIDINLPGMPVRKDWLHCNSLDYNEQKDLIVINSVQGECYVIDHGNTFVPGKPDSSIARAASPMGDFLYRFGDPARYEQGDPPSVLENWTKATAGHKQIGGSHNIQWIRPGLPGEGNLLVFNNAENLFELTPQSYIMEINPYRNSAGTTTGNFVNPPDAGYTVVNSPDANLMKERKNVSKQVVWSYSSKNNTSFYSTIGSSAQRLQNGNTLICSMNDGHFFEVSGADASIVWEYINPVTRLGIKHIKSDNYPTFNGVFRAYRYTDEHPALAGKILTASNTITGHDPDYLTPDLLNAIIEISDVIPEDVTLSPNYPNPFSVRTTIDIDLPSASQVSVIVYDLAGRQVRSLLSENRTQGRYSLIWDGVGDGGVRAPAGMYYYVLTSDGQTVCKKMIKIR